MVFGLAANDDELGNACFNQACFDFLNGEDALSSNVMGAMALAVAQFQQCCEKALKCGILKEAGRTLYGKAVKPSHKVWTKDLRNSQLREVRRTLESILETRSHPQNIGMLDALERLAPEKYWTHPNSEYPWVDDAGFVQVPAKYFAEREMEINNYRKLAFEVITKIRKRFTDLSPQWEEFLKQRKNRRDSANANQ